jgi:hypothetical protein
MEIQTCSERPYSIKCLFCPTTCDPRALNAKTAYEKDKMLMALLKRKDYPCFHSDAGCTFKGVRFALFVKHSLKSMTAKRFCSKPVLALTSP